MSEQWPFDGGRGGYDAELAVAPAEKTTVFGTRISIGLNKAHSGPQLQGIRLRPARTDELSLATTDTVLLHIRIRRCGVNASWLY